MDSESTASSPLMTEVPVPCVRCWEDPGGWLHLCAFVYYLEDDRYAVQERIEENEVLDEVLF